MNTEQIDRFNCLSEKVANTEASFDELKEFTALLHSFNNFVEFGLQQAFISTKNYNNLAES